MARGKEIKHTNTKTQLTLLITIYPYTTGQYCTNHEGKNERRAQHPGFRVRNLEIILDLGQYGRDGESIHVVDEVDKYEYRHGQVLQGARTIVTCDKEI